MDSFLPRLARSASGARRRERPKHPGWPGSGPVVAEASACGEPEVPEGGCATGHPASERGKRGGTKRLLGAEVEDMVSQVGCCSDT